MESRKSSEKQKKMFFALCRDLGYSSEEAKERAKLRFSLESFSDATVEQLNFLIDRLLITQEKRGVIKQNENL